MSKKEFRLFTFNFGRIYGIKRFFPWKSIVQFDFAFNIDLFISNSMKEKDSSELSKNESSEIELENKNESNVKNILGLVKCTRLSGRVHLNSQIRRS